MVPENIHAAIVIRGRGSQKQIKVLKENVKLNNWNFQRYSIRRLNKILFARRIHIIISFPQKHIADTYSSNWDLQDLLRLCSSSAVIMFATRSTISSTSAKKPTISHFF